MEELTGKNDKATAERDFIMHGADEVDLVKADWRKQ